MRNIITIEEALYALEYYKRNEDDINPTLLYSDDFDVVFGTRTTSIMISEGANMGWFLKWGNYAIAKLIEFLFNTSHLSDVGCTYRLIKRRAYEKIKNNPPES